MSNATLALRGIAQRAARGYPRRVPVPFGVDWTLDLAHYLNGRELGVVLDVGAHHGETALAVAEAFPSAQLHSFEPVPESFDVLERTLAGTGARATRAAVSERAGTIAIARGEESFKSGVSAPGERIEVPAVTVDGYCDERGIERIGLLKVDTEGHERAVLAGAQRRLEAGAVDFVLCECEFTRRPEEPHGDFSELLAQLAPLGYRVVSFYTGGADNLGWLFGDVLFMHAAGERDRRSFSQRPDAR